MIKKIIIGLLILSGLLTVVYLAGPSPAAPRYDNNLPVVPQRPELVEQYLRKQESNLPVKPGNQARIIWANDSLKEVTPYVMIYIHGFGACSEEGNPVHREIARKFGCNLLLTRLSDHGLKASEPMKDFTVDRLWNSALEYYALGKVLGKKVILMGTSTGGSLALKMAAEFPEIAGVILYSPNIEVNNEQAWLLNNPWGLQLARKIFHGKELQIDNKEPFYSFFWYNHYRLEAAVQLQEFTETAMTTETFRKVKQPLLLLYYYKDSTHQDKVVKVSAMLKMFDNVGTPKALRMKFPVPEAGDHVMACSRRSHDITSVENYTSQFLKERMHLSED
jgi:pimeloyl-ACP methyl ester carboxylesterase